MRETTPDLKDMAGLTHLECATRAAKNLADITAGHDVINLDEIDAAFPGGENEQLSSETVKKMLKTMKVPRGLHKNDPPRPILINCHEIFAPPLEIIFNFCLKVCRWPTAWKIETTHYINKKNQPEVLKDMRGICSTVAWSKCLESRVRDVILDDIGGGVGGGIHSGQFGGLKGLSSDMLLGSLYQDVADSWEQGYISILLCIDFTVAFNSGKSSFCVNAARNLGVREPILRLIASYLSQRQVEVTWGQETSPLLPLRGGSGQGTLMSVLLFLMIANELLRRLDLSIEEHEGHLTTKTKPLLFVDDCSLLLKYRRDSFGDADGPRVFTDDGRMSAYKKVIEEFSKDSGLLMNNDKTAFVSFDFSTNRLQFPDGSLPFVDKKGKPIKMSQEITLLGCPIQADLKFDALALARRKSGNHALWQMRRLSNQGVGKDHLLAVFKSYVRSRCEFGLLAASPMMTAENWKTVESVQRKATKIALGIRQNYGADRMEYDERNFTCGLDPLQLRTEMRFHEFAQKCERQPRFSHYFIRHADNGPKRRKSRDYELVKCTTERRRHAPFISMVRYLNAREDTPEIRMNDPDVITQLDETPTEVINFICSI